MDKIRIIFEIANNHQGSVSHFKNILEDIYNSSLPYKNFFEFFVKFQFRDLPNFIDQTIDPRSNKHISRFKETSLTLEEWEIIFHSVRDKGFKIMVTPFDEVSVSKALALNVDELKIASCSSTEWSLLKAVVKTNKYLTISTGGRNLREIDDIYSYLAHIIPGKFTIMHCCGIYPAPIDNLNLQSITKFKKRYPLASVGYSGHEDPNDHTISSLAISLGATSIERHIGKEDINNKINVNAYSIESGLISNWLKELSRTITILGHSKDYNYKNKIELESLATLQRGVFLSENIKAGEVINSSSCEFKFPIQENQVSASDITSIDSIYIAKNDIESGTRLTNDLIDFRHSNIRVLKNYIHKIRGIINEYAEYVPEDIEIELSHHYGIKDIETVGCCLINIINRSYCKKLIIMTEGQLHPTQHHEIKEETFRVLHGEIELILNGEKQILRRGQEALVRKGVKHSFKAIKNCIIEELSTTSINRDSFYEDSNINKLQREDRKTILNLHFDHFSKNIC